MANAIPLRTPVHSTRRTRATLSPGRIVHRTLLGILLLNISLQIEKHLFLRTDVSELGSLGGLQVSLTNLALAGLYLMWGVRSGLHRAPVPTSASVTRPEPSGLVVWAGLLTATYAVSLLAASDRALAAFEVANIVEQFLLLVYIARTTTSQADLVFIIRVLMLGLIIQSLLMLAQQLGIVGEVDVLGFKARAEFAGALRVSGTLGSPNPAAAYLGVSMMLAVGVLLARLERSDRVLAGAALALSILPMVFTLSRGGWAQLIVGIVIIVVAGGRRLPLRALASGAALLVCAMLPFRGFIMDRLFGDDNGSAAARMPLNHLALAVIADHPLAGVGANNFALAMQPYVASAFTGDFLYTVHNKYLLVFAETGAWGLLCFAALLIAILREGWKVWRAGEPVTSPIALACVAGVAGLMVQMTIEPARADPYSHLISLSGGLVVAMHRLGRGKAWGTYPSVARVRPRREVARA